MRNPRLREASRLPVSGEARDQSICPRLVLCPLPRCAPPSPTHLPRVARSETISFQLHFSPCSCSNLVDTLKSNEKAKDWWEKQKPWIMTFRKTDGDIHFEDLFSVQWVARRTLAECVETKIRTGFAVSPLSHCTGLWLLDSSGFIYSDYFCQYRDGGVIVWTGWVMGYVRCGFGQRSMVYWLSCSWPWGLRGVKISPSGPEKWLVGFCSLLPALPAAPVTKLI